MRIPRPEKSFYKIGEAAEIVGVPAHVLRYWESEFPMVKPMKTRGSHRMYRPKDVELLVLIRKLMHEQGYTLDGARKQLRRRNSSKQSQGGFGLSGTPTVPTVALEGTESQPSGQLSLEPAMSAVSSEVAISSEAKAQEKEESGSEAGLRMGLFRVREQLRSLRRELDQRSLDSIDETEEAIVVEHVVPKARRG